MHHKGQTLPCTHFVIFFFKMQHKVHGFMSLALDQETQTTLNTIKVGLISARENLFRQDYLKMYSTVLGGSNFRSVRSETHYPVF